MFIDGPKACYLLYLSSSGILSGVGIVTKGRFARSLGMKSVDLRMRGFGHQGPWYRQ